MNARTRRCRGTTLLETTLAFVVLSCAFVMLAQFLTAANQQRRLSEQRRLALQEAANVLEHVAALPWDDVTAEKLAAVTPSPALRSAAPAAELKLQLQADEGPPRAKRVHVEVAWPSAAGRAVEPVGLTTFLYPPEARP